MPETEIVNFVFYSDNIELKNKFLGTLINLESAVLFRNSCWKLGNKKYISPLFKFIFKRR